MPVNLFPGQLAPAFELLDQNGLIHSIDKYRGHWLVIFFYPRDDTPGCTKQLTRIQAAMREFNKRGVKIVGINIDRQDKHAAFAHRYHLDFPLLSDEDGQTCVLYDALWQFGPLRLVKRKSYIINPAGMVVRIFNRVRPKKHDRHVLHDLDLQQDLALQRAV